MPPTNSKQKTVVPRACCCESLDCTCCGRTLPHPAPEGQLLTFPKPGPEPHFSEIHKLGLFAFSSFTITEASGGMWCGLYTCPWNADHGVWFGRIPRLFTKITLLKHKLFSSLFPVLLLSFPNHISIFNLPTT